MDRLKHLKMCYCRVWDTSFKIFSKGWDAVCHWLNRHFFKILAIVFIAYFMYVTEPFLNAGNRYCSFQLRNLRADTLEVYYVLPPSFSDKEIYKKGSEMVSVNDMYDCMCVNSPQFLTESRSCAKVLFRDFDIVKDIGQGYAAGLCDIYFNYQEGMQMKEVNGRYERHLPISQ